MADLPIPGRDSVTAQAEMFRLAEKECGLSIKVIAARSPLSEGTMKGWRNGAAMPAWAIGALGAAGVPDHLLSLLTEPWGLKVVSVGGACALAELSRESAHFLAEKMDAEADGVLCHQDRARLTQRARRVTAAALKVVEREDG